MAALQRNYWTRPVPWLVALVHVAAYALLTGVLDGFADAIVFVLALAQVSLLALWGAAAPEPGWLRLPAAAGGIFAVWYSLSVYFLHDVSVPSAAGYFLMFAIQGPLVVVGIGLARVLRFAFRRWRAPGSVEGSRPLRYGLRTLMLWTTVLAVLLGLGRAWLMHLGWLDKPPRADDLLAFGFLGGYNALYALLVAATLWRRGYWPLRALVGLSLAGIAGWSEYDLATAIVPDAQFSWQFTALCALGQPLILYATLLPLGWSLAGPPASSAASQLPETLFLSDSTPWETP